MGKYSNEEIIRLLVEDRNQFYTFSYHEYLPMIQNFILKNSGNETDAKDLFHDTIVIIFNKINAKELKLTSSFKTYFFAISKNLWHQRLKILSKTDSIDDRLNLNNTVIEQEEYLDFEEEKLYQAHFKKLDKECQKILAGFFDKKSFRDIADDLKYKPSYIKKLKFKCKEKLIQGITNDPVFKELIRVRRKDRFHLNGENNESSANQHKLNNIQSSITNENKRRNRPSD